MKMRDKFRTEIGNGIVGYEILGGYKLKVATENSKSIMLEYDSKQKMAMDVGIIIRKKI